MTPGEELIDKLEQIRLRLHGSGVERTAGLGSHMGKDCDYYKKSLKMFLDRDYIDLRNLIQQANKLFMIVEGKHE